jgi:two-component system chemotaxis sensor kinase CheA
MKDMEEEIIRDLVQESLDHLGLIEPLLLQAESDPSSLDSEKMNHLFRALHSIKGGFSFVGKQNITRLSHAMENLLDKLRSGKAELTLSMVEAFIQCVDVLRNLLNQVDKSDEYSVEAEIARINAYLNPNSQATSSLPTTSGPEVLQPKANAPQASPPQPSAIAAPMGIATDADPWASPTFSEWPELVDFDPEEAAQHHAVKKFVYLLHAEKKAFGKSLPFRDWWETLGKLGKVLGTSAPLESLVPLKSGKIFPLQVVVSSILEPELMRAGVLHEGLHLQHWIPGGTPAAIASSNKPATWTPVSQEASNPKVTSDNTEPTAPSPAVAKAPTPPAVKAETNAADSGGSANDSLRIRLDLLNRLFNLAGELVLTRNQLVQTLDKRMDQALTDDMQTPIKAALQRALDGIAQSRHLDDSARVEILDLLNLMTSEIEDVLSRTLGQKLSDAAGAALTVQTMNRITSELQESIMGMRMQPIHTLFTKFSRLVRDLSRKLEKEIDLTIAGGDVELDKTILENLSDPLVHMIRNAGDHGLEMPAEREAAGKPRRGTIHLHAYHQGGYVILEIHDDGRGISAEKVRSKALEKGLITPEVAETMSDKDAHQLVFLPGFSTAAQVSDVSGRGVGMDVVRTNIEKLGGTVKIESVQGKGSTFILTLPLTLAIIPALMFSIEGRRLALPQVSVDEIIRVPAAEIGNRVTRVKDQEVLKLRGEILPLVRLTGILGIEPTFEHPKSGKRLPDRRIQLADRRLAPEDKVWAEEPLEGNETSSTQNETSEGDDEIRLPGLGRRQRHANLYVVLVRAADLRFGVVVDRIFNMEEVVVKPLPTYLKQCRIYAGTTFLGDGRVSLILDANGIVQYGKFRQVDTDL